ncbi:MAG: efflux RND transporter permease subunit [Spirochaetes bacterium]|nr:efflux RND transporter permease subunit [Spirochaetota bacterium]
MNKIVYRLVDFTQRHAWLVIAAVAAISVVLGFLALRLEVDADLVNIIPENSAVKRLTEKYGKTNTQDSHALLMFMAPDLFTAAKLSLVADACSRIEAVEHVKSGITPFMFLTFENRDGRLAIGTMAPGGRPPATDEEAQALRGRLLADPQARNLVISSDGDALCAIFPVEPVKNRRPILEDLEAIIAPLRSEMDVRIVGSLPLSRSIMDHLYTDLPVFLGLALVVILVSYFLSFRTLRSLVLPVLVVVLSTVWTVGTMTLLGFKLTVVSVATPPLVLILGSSYSLHVLNQYYREARVSGTDRRWIVDSVAHINTTIFLAAITTVFGFLSLLSASIRQLREFGIATAIGITYCGVLALFFLPAMLSLLKPPTAVQRDRVLEGFLARSLGRLTRVVTHGHWIVFIVSLVIAIVFGISLRGVRFETNFMKYLRNTEPVVVNNNLLVEKFTGYETLYLTLSTAGEQPGYFQDPAVLAAIGRYESALAADPDVKYLSSFGAYLRGMNRAMTGAGEVPSSRPLVLLLSKYFAALSSTPAGGALTGTLMNKDFSRYTIVLHVWDSTAHDLAYESSLRVIMPRLKALGNGTLPPGVTGEYWGDTITILNMSSILLSNQISSILLSAVLVFLVSAIVLRSVRHGLMVLAPLAVGIMLNFIIMAVFSIPLDAVTISFASVAIGIGVDNAIHLTIQYRRQREIWPGDPEKTIEHTLKVAGRPMVLTSLSIMLALLVFVFSAFRPLVYFGVLISLSLVTTTAGALILLPAVLYVGSLPDARKARRVGQTAR